MVWLRRSALAPQLLWRPGLLMNLFLSHCSLLAAGGRGRNSLAIFEINWDLETSNPECLWWGWLFLHCRFNPLPIEQFNMSNAVFVNNTHWNPLDIILSFKDSITAKTYPGDFQAHHWPLSMANSWAWWRKTTAVCKGSWVVTSLYKFDPILGINSGYGRHLCNPRGGSSDSLPFGACPAEGANDWKAERLRSSLALESGRDYKSWEIP